MAGQRRSRLPWNRTGPASLRAATLPSIERPSECSRLPTPEPISILWSPLDKSDLRKPDVDGPTFMSYGSDVASSQKQVCVIVGATSKWQADGRNTKLALGREVDDSTFAPGVRWGIGGALAQKFAAEGFCVVLTTRVPSNALSL